MKNKQKQKPRTNTEKHGIKTLLSEPDALATVATLRKRIQLFIAYLYKPEAQAKVFKMTDLHSPIIPSLALQAYQTRDTVKSRFPHPPLDKKESLSLPKGL